MTRLSSANENEPYEIRRPVSVSARPFVVTGSVDASGQLVAADARLLALNRQAGGDDNGPIAIPQLATLTRMARTLGVTISRAIIVADGDIDRELTVNASPSGALINLLISGWQVREAPMPSAAMQADRAHYYTQFETDGLWTCDARLRLSHVPVALVALCGVKRGTATDLEMTKLFHLVENDDGSLPLLTGCASRVAFAGQMADLRDAPTIGLRLHGLPLFAETGEFEGFSGGFAFINRAHSLPTIASLIDQHVENDDAGNAVEQALRRPVVQIIAQADQLASRQSGPLRAEYTTYAHDISAAGRHLLGLIDDISDLQTVEHPAFRTAEDRIDLADIARRSASLLRVRASDRNVRIDAPSLDEVIMATGDFRRVLQIIVNLLSNAVRYSPPGSSVWIRSEIEGDLAAIIVADQGKGIAPEDQLRVFDKFERVDTTEPGGTGLGLYISRKLARAMNGDINVDSAPGQGSRFVLTLPAAL